ncbi:Na+/H+ antiporter family protein [Jeotgalibacillus haloalkalitolerans]|uniref:Na+/H+ antiporter family protein n=1 Tax=Jeotgalibacillus haloalkalitolerans TaxID=3104292 RepID=A0ABU5KQW0_9BACL|nr:Na+/H+ antiporter family protein [Jeotgalibacillus sp. HH7-29]MDZ5713632.1 Na+/H+ antiporter family protein [Jeotgalibacillus sp. HH7-29]
MNAVVIAVIIMLVLSLIRINVVAALIIGAAVGGLVGGLSVEDTVSVFSEGVGGGANIALSYALLGGFAVAISYTGLPKLMVDKIVAAVSKEGEPRTKALPKVLIVLAILSISIMSQNIVPVHIAFIPLLIPPLLLVMNELGIDRRLIATVITFGLTAPYILLPYGFGQIFHDTIATNMELSGLAIDLDMIPTAMLIPTAGMILGLLVAIFISYRKPREYQNRKVSLQDGDAKTITTKDLIVTILAIIAALVIQSVFQSMVFSAVVGLAVLFVSGTVKLRDQDQLMTDGMRMMAFIGFVMISANGFAAVMTETGAVESLVNGAADLIGDNKAVGALLMLIVGLVVTMGIGSSFATVPIIAVLFVPLSLELGFSPLATIALIGTAGALGDAGSPASDSTLGPTAGLNADGQHNHIWDTCVPTFLHYNIPLILFGWIAALVL